MTLVITKDTQGKTFPALMTVVASDQEIDIKDMAVVGKDAKVKGHNLADLLSAISTHERGGAKLYRCVSELTEIDAWRQKYEEFGKQTENHIRICEETIKKIGGDPMYVSLSARMTELQNNKLMEFCLFVGSCDNQTLEIAALESVLIAELKCHANWHFVGELAKQFPEGKTKKALMEAVEQIEPQEDQHVEWAQTTWKKALTAQITGK